MTPRLRPAAIALVVLVASLAAPRSLAATHDRTTADVTWVGFRIPRTELASSGWIGARQTRGGATVYRVDPTKRRVTLRFGDRKWAARFKSSRSGRRVTRANTACAALLLGKYGARAADLQAAGVDVAVYHLLYGGGYAYDGAAQTARTDQRANGPLIRAYAQNLVENHCPLRGPYHVSLTTGGDRAEVGDVVASTVTVRSRTGVPMANIPVTVSEGTRTRSLVTGDDGTVSFGWTALRSGPLTIRTLTHNLPFTKVRYFVPRRSGASRVVQAGLKQDSGYPRARTIPVLGQPTLALDPDRPVTRGVPFGTRFRLADSYDVPRRAVVQLYGPFTVADNAGCRPGRLARDSSVAVGPSARYRSRQFTVRQRGWYVWRVRVAGDALYNRPVARCGGIFRLQ